ncbi:MAG: aldo/keto reductase [Firmicutes bacterium]|nr:aldo/keto reductase [Bacillota bacterium]
MKYTKLAGMDVSKICLGCMSFGSVDSGFNNWALPEDESHAIIKRAVEAGINFFDTANIYSFGSSEEFLGRALKKYAKRDEIVVATKVFNPMKDAQNTRGLSRKTILHEVDNSLKRLGLDYIDLYVTHRWDYNVPIEETMSALHDIIKMGKVRYIGASSMFAWQLQKAQFVAEKHNWTKFVSVQNHYNLIYREDEREMIPMCLDQNIQGTPYSPLASGRLSHGTNSDSQRTKTDDVQKQKYQATEQEDQIIIDRVAETAKNHGVSPSQIALAWTLHKPFVASPVMGVTKMPHLEDAINAVDISLSTEEINYLEEMYVPHKMVGPIPPTPNWVHGADVKRR